MMRRVLAIRNRFRARCCFVQAHRNVQPEAHRIENIKNRREIWLYWIACERTMNARPRKPRLLREVRNCVQMGGSANGMTNSGDEKVDHVHSKHYFAIECLVGATVDVGAAFEIAKVNQTFQPSGRFSEANSL